jgi:HSF-type DNA-binding
MFGHGKRRRNIQAYRNKQDEPWCPHSLSGQMNETKTCVYDTNEYHDAYVCRNGRQIHPSSLFPAKLHVALQQTEREHFDHIISWAAHGRCFMIHKRFEFVQRVLPR